MKKTKLLAVLLSLVLMGRLAIGVTVAGIGTSMVGSIVNSYTGGNSQVYANTITKSDGTVVYYVYSSNILNTQTVLDNLRNALRNPYSSMIPAVADEDGTVGLAVCSDSSFVDSMDENWISSEWVGRNVVAVGSVKNVTNEIGDGIDEGAIATMHEEAQRNLAAQQAAEAENHAKWQAKELERKSAWDAAEEAKAEEDPDYVPQEYVGSEYVPLDFGDTAIENQRALESNQFESVVATMITTEYGFKDGKLLELSNIENVMHVTTIYAEHTIIDDTESITTDEEEQEVIPAPHGRGGGGGFYLRRDNCPDGDFSDSYYDGTCGKQKIVEDEKKITEDEPEEVGDIQEIEDKQDIVEEKQTVTEDYYDSNSKKELQTAYTRAYQEGIVTKEDIKNYRNKLTRVDMARLLGNYAVDVLGMKIDDSREKEFKDVGDEEKSVVDRAYKLGIMGINMPNNEFRPYDEVSAAEFITALSRLLYGTEDGKGLYYSTHMNLMKESGLINDLDPNKLEKYGDIIVMLMKSK